MGNGIGKIGVCFTGIRPHNISVVISDPLDEGLGHSFCYIRPDPVRLSSSKVHSEETTTFRSISGASVSANTSTPLSTAFVDLYSYQNPYLDRSAAAFESSNSFAAIPLQPVPRFYANSGPLSVSGVHASGPLERGFMSGPIERGFLSGPLDRSIFSGPLEKGPDQFQRSFSHGSFALRSRSKKGNLLKVFLKAGRPLRRAIASTIARGHSSIVAPIKGALSVKEIMDWSAGTERNNGETVSSTNLSSDLNLDDEYLSESQNLQWAQGKAGEDRVHVVLSEEQGWLFVGIYDGFNGPDAPDYLLSNLYSSVQKELKGLLWEEKGCCSNESTLDSYKSDWSLNSMRTSNPNQEMDYTSQCIGTENCGTGRESEISGKNRGIGKKSKKKMRGAVKKSEENQRRWNCEWDRERLELDRRLKEQLNRTGSDRVVNHSDVLKALSHALRKTEEAYLEIADKMVIENPELALMGSCVLVMLMKGEDVYLMNVGDSRGVLAQKPEPDIRTSLPKSYKVGEPATARDLARINEETSNDHEASDAYFVAKFSCELPNLAALQLTLDHSTTMEEEVLRIKTEHQDDPSAIANDRVKGSLKVTRAFGAGFLKQPKWNTALLEMFRIDYVGNSPYITCNPSLYHHRLGPKDQFLILSSDGLYQYFTNEEAVSEVELFIASFPDGDPAQHLVEEVLFRAAEKAGMDFHELLEIPQGDRRRYHDDVSIIVISLEGRIWRYCV